MRGDEIGVDLALLIILVAEYLVLEIQVRLDALDHQLAQGAPHLGDGRGSVLVVDNQLK